MFDLLDRPLHWIGVKWPALVTQKKDKRAEPGEHEIELRVQLIDREEVIWRFPSLFPLDDVESEMRKGVEARGPSPSAFDTFKSLVSDWRKLKADGRKPELNDANIKLLLAVPMFEAAFAIAYLSAVGGRVQAREGNSAASPSGGRGDTDQAAPETSSSATANDSD